MHVEVLLFLAITRCRDDVCNDYLDGSDEAAAGDARDEAFVVLRGVYVHPRWWMVCLCTYTVDYACVCHDGFSSFFPFSHSCFFFHPKPYSVQFLLKRLGSVEAFQ